MERITSGVFGWEGNQIAEDPRVEEDLGYRLPKGCEAEICVVWGKTLCEKVKEAKLSFEIPKARRVERTEDPRSVGGHKSTNHVLQLEHSRKKRARKVEIFEP
jgi:hypothetical protein